MFKYRMVYKSSTSIDTDQEFTIEFEARDNAEAVRLAEKCLSKSICNTLIRIEVVF